MHFFRHKQLHSHNLWRPVFASTVNQGTSKQFIFLCVSNTLGSNSCSGSVLIVFIGEAHKNVLAISVSLSIRYDWESYFTVYAS